MTFQNNMGLFYLLIMITLACSHYKGGLLVDNNYLNSQNSFIQPKANKYYVYQNKDINPYLSILEFTDDSIKIYDFTGSSLSFYTGIYLLGKCPSPDGFWNSTMVTAILDENYIISLNTGTTLSVKLNCNDVIYFKILSQDSITKNISLIKGRYLSDKIILYPVDSNKVYTWTDSIKQDISWVESRRNLINIKESQIIDCSKQK